MRRQILIWGGSGHAVVVADLVRQLADREIVGFLDDVNPRRAGEPFADGVILGGREQLPLLRAAGVEDLVVAVGDCAARLSLSAAARLAGYRLPVLVHPSAVVSRSASIGEGTVVCAGAVVGPGATIGASVLINTSASVDHQCVLCEGVHVGPGAHLAGNVRVGRGSFLGLGVSVTERVIIGDCCVVGAGAVVVGDVPNGIVVVGIPARELRRNG